MGVLRAGFPRRVALFAVALVLGCGRTGTSAAATCIAEHALQVDLDFESGKPGRLQFSETKSLNCPPSQEYCKASLSLDLALGP